MTPSDLTRLDAQLHGLHLHYIQSQPNSSQIRASCERSGEWTRLIGICEGTYRGRIARPERAVLTLQILWGGERPRG
jgi:hypothetical protein